MQASEGFRTTLLQHTPHQRHAPPVWSYCMRACFAQTARMPPLVLFVLVSLLRTKTFIKLVDFFISFIDGNSVFSLVGQ